MDITEGVDIQLVYSLACRLTDIIIKHVEDNTHVDTKAVQDAIDEHLPTQAQARAQTVRPSGGMAELAPRVPSFRLRPPNPTAAAAVSDTQMRPVVPVPSEIKGQDNTSAPTNEFIVLQSPQVSTMSSSQVQVIPPSPPPQGALASSSLSSSSSSSLSSAAVNPPARYDRIPARQRASETKEKERKDDPLFEDDDLERLSDGRVRVKPSSQQALAARKQRTALRESAASSSSREAALAAAFSNWNASSPSATAPSLPPLSAAVGETKMMPETKDDEEDDEKKQPQSPPQTPSTPAFRPPLPPSSSSSSSALPLPSRYRRRSRNPSLTSQSRPSLMSREDSPPPSSSP